MSQKVIQTTLAARGSAVLGGTAAMIITDEPEKESTSASEEPMDESEETIKEADTKT